MSAYYLLIPAALLLMGLLWAERDQRSGRVLIFKTPLSALFVVAALLQPHPLPVYFWLILIGLLLGLAGDVCLALTGEAAFKAGLAAFLLGHVAYVAALAGLTPPSMWINPGLLAICALSGLVFLWLRPHLGPMLVPVLAYIVVITLMLMGAWACLFNPALPRGGAWAVLVGAGAFYFSDLFVARDRFVRPGWDNRLLGLPLYYGGQFSLALSVGLVA